MSDLFGLFVRSLSLAREHFLLFTLAVALSTVCGAAIELAPEDEIWWCIISASLVGIIFQALVNASALGLEPVRTVGNRFVSIIGWGFLASIFLGIGLLLLVIPGLVLLLRWSISLPILLVEGQGAYESLQRSWQLTAGRWRLAIAIPAVVMLGWLPSFILPWFAIYAAKPMPLVLAVNAFGSLLIVFSYFLGVALYGQIRGEVLDTRLPEIFS